MDHIDYTKTTWVNNITPVNEINMNHIESGIETATLTINAIIDELTTQNTKIDQEIRDRIADVNEEETRAKAAEKDINDRIDDLDLDEKGADGSYIKIISQLDGQVSATPQAFDLTLDAATDNNAPTSKTVKDYADAIETDIHSKAVHKGTEQEPSNETIYGTKTFKSEQLFENNIDLNNSDIENVNYIESAYATIDELSIKDGTQFKLGIGQDNIPYLFTTGVLSNGSTSITIAQIGTKYEIQSVQNNINTVDNKLDTNVHIVNTDASDKEFVYDTTNPSALIKKTDYKNLKTSAAGTKYEELPLANASKDGLMSHTDYNTILDNKRRIDALEGTPVRLIYTASQNPTAAEIKTFVDNYLAGKGILTPTDSDYNSVSVKISGTNHIWNYYANDGTYKDDGLDTVTQFTNSIAGIILGSPDTVVDNAHINDGKVYAESNGTGSVIGWDALKTRVSNIENNYVTTNTTQDITGTKTFNAGIIAKNSIKLNGALTPNAYAIFRENDRVFDFLFHSSSGSNKTLFVWDAERGNIDFSISIAPHTNNTYDLGYSNAKWRNLYLAGKLSDGTNEITIANIESSQNKTTSLSASSTDVQYPSAKAVYDALLTKQDTMTALTASEWNAMIGD